VKKFEFQIAWRYLGAQRKSFFVSLISLFSMAGVAIGTFALVVVLSAINGFEAEVTQQMMGKDAHFELMRYHMDPIPGWDTLLTRMEKDPDVVGASPFILTKVGVSSRKVNDGIVLYGIDLERAKGTLDLHKQVKWGAYDLDSTWDSRQQRRPTVILGTTLANRLRVVLGDPIVLQTFAAPEQMGLGAAGPRLVQCIVSGIFESGMYEYDANIAYVSLATAQGLLSLGSDEATGISARVRDPWQAEKVAGRIQESLGYPYYAMDWKAKNHTLLKWMGIEKILFGAVIALIIVVAAFNIISSLIMLVLEKTREIGILRAMGASSASVMRVFVMVGGSIGVLGTILGTTAGVGLCWAQMQWGLIKLPADVYMVSVFPVKIMWQDVAAVFAVGNIICLLVTIPPAWKASRMDPVGAIRHE
jgi:lipoprotein-releasing system permease protein